MILCPTFMKDVEKCLPYRAMEDAAQEIVSLKAELEKSSLTIRTYNDFLLEEGLLKKLKKYLNH